MDSVSIMTDTQPDLHQRIAARIAELRSAQAMSLETLARRSGVSRSMISLIERSESSPTAVVLAKLAAALGVTLASLFDDAGARAPDSTSPIARRDDQIEWKDPASGYRRRNISPPGIPQPMQIVDVHFPAGARVVFEQGVRETRLLQQVWILTGSMDITLGTECHSLREGDCIAMHLDQLMIFSNPTAKPAHYAVVLCTDAAPRR
jgi:transcriptional regulator with XRE-family HTH domain